MRVALRVVIHLQLGKQGISATVRQWPEGRSISNGADGSFLEGCVPGTFRYGDLPETSIAPNHEFKFHSRGLEVRLALGVANPYRNRRSDCFAQSVPVNDKIGRQPVGLPLVTAMLIEFLPFSIEARGITKGRLGRQGT
jgi:hypothetical protein